MSSDKDLVELSDTEKEGLRATAQIVELEWHLKELYEKLEMLEIRFTVEESINKAHYLEKKDKYHRKVEETKNSLDELRKSGKKVELLTLLDAGRQFQSKREKLIDLLRSKKISESTFSKMDSDYQTKIDEIEQNIATEIMRLEKIKRQLKNTPYDLQLEEAYARKAVGELNEIDYEKTVVELKKKQKEATEICSGIEKILSRLE
ncbi:MAG: hypothetical protein ACE5R6_05325 [Candidatus Heimdallarchaeota archaeon]